MKPGEATRLLVRAGDILDRMMHARYHGGGSAKAANHRWGEIHRLADEIDAALGPRASSPARRLQEQHDAQREARIRERERAGRA
jgi:hypothetical protein